MEGDINVDELLSEISAPDAGRAMSGEGSGETPPPAAEPTTPPDWRSSFDWQFDANGKSVSPDSAEKAKTWLSLGHNYSQRAAELNRQREQYAAKERELAQKYQGYDTYAEIAGYAQQNPDWWNHMQQGWQSSRTDGVDPKLAPILQDLEQTKSFIADLKEQRAQEEREREDQALDAEIGEIRKAYPNIDLNAADETGLSLEFRVIKHANDNQIQSFRAAFRDYLHDRLVEEAKASARGAVAKDTQMKTKAGILGQTPAPTKVISRAQNVRGKSYADLAQEALAEFGIS